MYHLLKNINVIIGDNRRFSNYFKKNYPNIYFYLPIIKILTSVSLFVSMTHDFNIFKGYLSYALREGSEDFPIHSSWSLFIFYFYLCTISFQFIMSMIIITYANPPVRNKAFQIVKHTLVAGTVVIPVSYGIAYSPIEPNPISNYVHTKLPGGRGYDFEVGDLASKIKGHTLASHLGKEKMLEAVAEHGPSSKILKREHIVQVVTDPKYRDVICKDASLVERTLLGVPFSLSYAMKKSIDSAFNNTSQSSADESSQKSYSQNHEKEDNNEETTFEKSSNFEKFKTDPLKKAPKKTN